MNKKLLAVAFFVLASVSSYAQSVVPHDKWCGTSYLVNDILATEEGQRMKVEADSIRAFELENPTLTPRGFVYQIPVVFHVLHNGGPENVSEEQIYNALDVINRDFRLQNSDTSAIVAQFKPLLKDAEIQFVLATKAPDGSCFKGYTRTKSPLSFDGSNGTAQKNEVRDNNDVYQGEWGGTKYLNVFVVGDAGGAGGYTTYPAFGGTSMKNGIVILYTQFGEIGTSSTTAGRSLTHECGHWLNLPHTWGGTNTPGLAGNCSSDDGISDTPNCMGAAGGGGCLLTDNGCGPVANVQNYMDYYLSCQKMFTAGQVDEMRLAIASSVGGRSNLWSSQNLAATGAESPVLCAADFQADRTSICAGETVNFSDESFNMVTGWSWNFTGGSPANSNVQNPSVTYSTPGLYEVSLTATDGSSNVTEVKTGYIRVLPAATNLPFLDDFEGYSTLSNIEQWEVVNPDGNKAFELESTVGHTGSKSARLLNFNESEGSIDELVSAPVDLSGISGSVTLSFRYAYKRRTSNDDDWLRVYASPDCGQAWAIRKTLHGIQLGSTTQSTAFTPSSSADWTTVHVTNITSTYWTNNFRYKFRFEGGGGNNFYLDNINIYSGSPSDALVVGLEELEDLTRLAVFPNPTDNELNVQFSVQQDVDAIFEIQDITGKQIQRHLIKAAQGSNMALFDVQSMASGMYFLKVSIGSSFKTIQFMVK